MVDALRAEVAGLTDRLSRVESVAAATAASVARSDMAAMEARLAPMSLNGTAPSTSGVPDAIADGSPILARLAADGSYSSYVPGRVDPFFGRANMLFDPVMEGVLSTTTLGAGFTTCGEEWEGKRSFVGSGSPVAYIERYAARELSNTSSVVLRVRMRWNASTGSPVSSEVQFQPYQDVTPSDDCPWLVAAVRFRSDPADMVAQGVTGTARVCIVDSGGTEVATSDEVVLEEGDGSVETWLSCAVAAPSGGYRPRIVVTYAATSIPSSREVLSPQFLELQMNESDSEDPPAFTPAIGGWVPQRTTMVALDPDVETIVSVEDGDADYPLVVYGDGSVSWYSSLPVLPMAFASQSDTAARNTTTPADIPGCSFPVKAGRTYVFHVIVPYDVTGTNQCAGVGFTHPGGAAIANIVVETNATTGAATRDRAGGSTAGVDYMGTAVGSVADTNRKVIVIDGHYRATDDGSFQFRYARNGTSNSPGVTVVEGAGGWAVANPA